VFGDCRLGDPEVLGSSGKRPVPPYCFENCEAMELRDSFEKLAHDQSVRCFQKYNVRL